jgi:AcrR family transcriptional regulator
MATQVTQSLILEAAVDLFNQYGISKVSSNKIAVACNISKGNLHYHFKTKGSIIHSIYDHFSAEVRNDWRKEDSPTSAYMATMLSRQLRLIWNYRFFYRELIPILNADAHLRYKFSVDRHQRIEEVVVFFKELRDKGFISRGLNDQTMVNLVKTCWILSDNWINYLEVDIPIDAAISEMDDYHFQTGHQMIIDLFQPYFTTEALAGITS